MGTILPLESFMRANKSAWQLAWKATDDYLLARLGIQNALWSGFEIATQSMEKFLKAYLLFKDKALNGDADKVRRAVSAEAKKLGRDREPGHDVAACLTLARSAGLASTTDLGKHIDRINDYYARRYPGQGGPTSLGTDELHDVDQAIFEAWDAFEVIHPEYYFSSGLMMPVYGVLLDQHHGRPNPISLRAFSIMTTANRSFDRRRVKLEHGARDLICARYPRAV